MLARVADNLYWMGRYLERAENVSRLLTVTHAFAGEIEGLDRQLAVKEWQILGESLPGPQKPAERRPGAIANAYFAWYLAEPENPVSVLACLNKARENARAIGDGLTRETFVTLNETFATLNRGKSRAANDLVRASDLNESVHYGLLTTLGAIENTFSRDEGWRYLKLGEAMERTQRTLSVLRAKLPALNALSEDADPALVFSSWRNLLTSLASLENFRKAHRTDLVPRQVLRFLMFEAEVPRSVLCGVRRMSTYVGAMSEQVPHRKTVLRTLGKLNATLTYDEDEILTSPDLGPFLTDCLRQLFETHDGISAPAGV